MAEVQIKCSFERSTFGFAIGNRPYCRTHNDIHQKLIGENGIPLLTRDLPVGYINQSS